MPRASQTRRWTVASLMMAACVALASCRGTLRGERAYRSIPLSRVYATWTLAATKHLPVTDELYVAATNSAHRQDVFLVNGDRIDDAARQAVEIFSPTRSGAHPRLVRSQNLWAVAYLGYGGSAPPAFDLISVGRSNSSVRIVYEVRRANLGTSDLYPYLVFVPLRGTTLGEYRVELYDATESEVRVARTERVTP